MVRLDLLGGQNRTRHTSYCVHHGPCEPTIDMLAQGPDGTSVYWRYAWGNQRCRVNGYIRLDAEEHGCQSRVQCRARGLALAVTGTSSRSMNIMMRCSPCADGQHIYSIMGILSS